MSCYVMLYSYLSSAFHRRLLSGALSVTGRRQEKSSNYKETLVISPVGGSYIDDCSQELFIREQHGYLTRVFVMLLCLKTPLMNYELRNP